MSPRLSSRSAFVLALSVIVMLLVSAPMLAFANDAPGSPPATPPGNSSAAPGQSDAPPPGQASSSSPGNSAAAPGHTSGPSTTSNAPSTSPGNSGNAPGQSDPGPAAPSSGGGSGDSNAGGNSSSAGGSNANAGGGSSPDSNAGGSSNAGSNGGSNSNAGGGNSNSRGNSTAGPDSGGKSKAGSAGSQARTTRPPKSGSGSSNGDPAHQKDCDQNDDGVGGPYDATCDGTHQNPGPGNSDNSPGKPADGTVGKADNKNPKGQQPGGSDHNKGYECEPGRANKGVGKGNPAHTGCKPPTDTQGNDCLGHPLSLGHNHTAAECNPPKQYDCAGHLLPNDHPANECQNPPPRYDCMGHPLPNDHDHTGECTTPPPDCDGDGIDDNVDSDLSGCQPPPPPHDCDGDGVSDDVDSDLSNCQPSVACPDGSPLPANGKCDKPSVVPDLVLGVRVNRSPAKVLSAAVQPAAVAAAPSVAASLLPFTGGNILPFVLVSLGLIGAGLPALRRRKD